VNRHAAIELEWLGETRTFRLALGQVEELESRRDCSVFELAERLARGFAGARYGDVEAVLGLGLVGGGMPVREALKIARETSERSMAEDLAAARVVILAALARVHGPEREADGDEPDRHERMDFKAILASATIMQVQNVLDLSVGQWAAICEGWNKAHGGVSADAPTGDELEAAMAAARV
jgi:hypothetical protein